MKNQKMRSRLLAIIFLAIFLASCTSVSEEEAKNSAILFIKSNVAFHAENKTISAPYMQVVNSKKESGMFVFDIIATTTAEEKVKSAKFNVVVDKDGKVILFNNQSTALMRPIAQMPITASR